MVLSVQARKGFALPLGLVARATSCRTEPVHQVEFLNPT